MTRTSNKQIVLMVVAALVMSLHLVVLMGIIVSFLPMEYHQQVQDFFIRHRTVFLREYDLVIYRAFIILFFGLCAAGYWLLAKNQEYLDEIQSNFSRFIMCSTFWLVLSGFAILKICIYEAPQWAQIILYVSVVGHILTLVFWPEVNKAVERGDSFFRSQLFEDQKIHWIEGAVLMFLACVIAIRTDQMMLVGHMLATWLYFILFYIFLRVYVKHILLSLFGLALAVKWQMFHYGVAPIIWMHPPHEVLNYFWDMGFFICLWQFLQKRTVGWVLLAAFFVGIALIWKLDTGFYLLIAFYCALILSYRLSPKSSDGINISILKWAFLLPLIMASIFYMMVKGKSLCPSEAMPSLPYFYCLRQRHFGSFALGYLIPIFYVWTMLVGFSLKEVLLTVISLYGLLLFGHYLSSPVVSGFYAVCIPLVVILCFWFKWLVGKYCPVYKNHILLAGLLIILLGLFVNRLFLIYPRIILGP